MIWPSAALAASGALPSKAKAIVIWAQPDLYKISIGKRQDAQVGAKGVISRDGKDIAQFEITSVDMDSSQIKVTDLTPGASVRINDNARITSVPQVISESKPKKKSDGALKVLGGLLLAGALIALGSSGNGGGGGGGGGSTGGGGTVGAVTVTASPNNIPADGISTSEITATVVDRNNSAVPDGTVVRFSATAGAISPSQTTTTDGKALATLTSGTAGGTCTVTAAAGGKSGTALVTFTGGPAPTTRSISLVANPARVQVAGSLGGVTSSTITATCLENGNPAAGGVVTFSSSIGSVLGTAAIGAGGIATTTFSSDKTGEAIITATWENATATTSVVVTSGPPHIVLAEVSPGAIECDGHSFATVTATVKDLAGNPVTDGTIVQFSVQPDVTGGGNGSITAQANTAGGKAMAILISRTPAGAVSNPGTATVVAQVPIVQPPGIPAPSVVLSSRETQVQFTSLDVAFIRLGANPINIRGWDYVGRTTTIEALVFDSRRNPVPDGTAVYFTTDHGMIYGNSGMAGNVALSLTSLGRAQATLVSAAEMSGWNGLVDVTATSGAVSVTAADLVIFSGWPSPPNCSAVMEVNNLAACQDSSVITVVALDVNGNPVVDGTPVTISTTKGTLSNTTPTTVGGVVQTTLSTSADCANPTASGPGKIKIAISSGGNNPETGGLPVQLSLDFTIL